MIYQFYEMQRAAWAPVALAAEATRLVADTLFAQPNGHRLGRAAAAACEILARTTRQHRNVAFDIANVMIDGVPVEVEERIAASLPFCTLRHFARKTRRRDPALLVVAPLSGHCSALLNDAVRTLLEAHEVYLTDWHDAREVPRAAGPFDLDGYIDYLIGFLRKLGPDLHVVAFSQSTVPTLAAAALLARAGDGAEPRTLTLVAGPLDTRVNSTPSQLLAARQPRSLFEATMISRVPLGYRGQGRRVLPGFVQLAGYISHNLGRHMDAHWDFFGRLVDGDLEGAEAHRRFYDRFFSVLDLPAEFFLATLTNVFQEHRLARGTMAWRGLPVDTRLLRRPALLTIEGGLDDVSAPGQTRVAHELCPAIPSARRAHHLEPAAGHLALFYGHHWRQAIAPRIAGFIRENA
ncbi:MAG TPA: polyhydroxyalkanoate depolymerase [Alphaproteobacteria bacterium]|nr:polyhydroxyalkanoate depolymerase [Alphaproteobacteria bacterium]